MGTPKKEKMNDRLTRLENAFLLLLKLSRAISAEVDNLLQKVRKKESALWNSSDCRRGRCRPGRKE